MSQLNPDLEANLDPNNENPSSQRSEQAYLIQPQVTYDPS